MVESLRAIAKLAGVSPSTVTRVLHDSPRISEARKREIRQLLALHGYLPHPTENAAGTIQTIGAVIANPQGGMSSDNFFSDVVQGAIRFLRERGGQLVIETIAAPAGASTNVELPKAIAERRAQAVIVGGIPLPDGLIELLVAQGFPVVFIGKYTDDYTRLNAVISDNVAGGRLVGKHLVECGYEEFYFIGGNQSIYTFADRLRGFQEGLAAAGARLAVRNIVTMEEIDQTAGYHAAKMLLARLGEDSRAHPRRVRRGIFASTDWMAAGVIRALSEAGEKIPDSFGVVGYSDLELASHLIPSLTTVHMDKDQLGFLAARTAVDLLTNAITGPIQIFQQPRLVARESTTTAGAILAETRK